MCQSIESVATILECNDSKHLFPITKHSKFLAQLIEVALRFYKCMLELADQHNIDIFSAVEESGALDSFEALQMHQSDVSILPLSNNENRCE